MRPLRIQISLPLTALTVLTAPQSRQRCAWGAEGIVSPQAAHLKVGTGTGSTGTGVGSMGTGVGSMGTGVGGTGAGVGSVGTGAGSTGTGAGGTRKRGK